MKVSVVSLILSWKIDVLFDVGVEQFVTFLNILSYLY